MAASTGSGGERRLPELRILAFCDYFSSESSGGSERAAWEIYRRLAQQGAQIRLITITNCRTPSQKQVDGIGVHEIPLVDLSGIIRAQVAIAPALLRCVRPIARTFAPHVLHAHNIYFQTTLAAALLHRRIGVPLVTTAQIGTLSYVRKPIRWLAQGYEGTLGRFILSRSVRVIAVSDSVRQHLLELGTASDRVRVIFNGVDLEHFRPGPTGLARHDSTPLVLFIGRLIANKGPQVMLRALFLLKQENVPFKALFIGDGPLRLALERRVRAAGLEGTIGFAGQVDRPAKHIRAADVVVRPSFSEGMPLTVLEAMASRVCVIASDIPGNRDLIQDGRNGLLVPPGSARDLADAIRHVLEDHQLRGQLARAGYQTAIGYSWDTIATQTADVLSAVRLHQGQTVLGGNG